MLFRMQTFTDIKLIFFSATTIFQNIKSRISGTVSGIILDLHTLINTTRTEIQLSTKRERGERH